MLMSAKENHIITIFDSNLKLPTNLKNKKNKEKGE